MPRVSYAKAIDWYLMGSFIFVFTTLIACLFVYRFESTGVEKNQSQTLPGRENSSSTVNVNTEAQNDRQTDLARIREELERNLPFSSPDLSHCPEFAMMEAQSRRYYGHGTVEQEVSRHMLEIGFILEHVDTAKTQNFWKSNANTKSCYFTSYLVERVEIGIKLNYAK